jgi:adenosine deaminase
VFGYFDDARNSYCPFLLGVGFPVTINADDPGKFRMEDATTDYFLAAISYRWRLRHLKLVGLHSLNYALCSLGQREIL